MASRFLLVGLLLATYSLVALASDPSPLQDFCVADNSKVLVNGFVCKDPNMVKADDFLFRGLDKMRNTTNAVGSNVTANNFFCPSQMASRFLLVGLLLATCSLVALASDPSPLQDFCVADNSKVLVNGFVCKDPNMVKADDFLFRGLDKMRNTTNAVGSNVTADLGISMVRIDYAPWGQNAPHTHPRATEILVVIEGSLLVGFVTSNTDNKLFTKRLEKGDVFVFPEVAIAALSSQNPGVITIANAVFGSNPDISDDILARAFQVDKKVIDEIQSKF
ncbi:germin-like protein 2-1 [Artemisia annua]|uniref:Germin-like protein n=1 Tax=Artemisia annua TaxID=35608 RepID=A0A2U1NNH3_ARTAN|nr:germin-like protein 2-1 [Artemisia annua]